MRLSDSVESFGWRGGAVETMVLPRILAPSGQRTGIFDGLLAHSPKARIFRRFVGVGRFAFQYAARLEELLEGRLVAEIVDAMLEHALRIVANGI
jgi:hypothetical protein